MPMKINNRATYVYCGSGGVVGVDARTGAVLWETTEWENYHCHRPFPGLPGRWPNLPLRGIQSRKPDASGVRGGGEFLRANPFSPKGQAIGSTQQTPIFHQGISMEFEKTRKWSALI